MVALEVVDNGPYLFAGGGDFLASGCESAQRCRDSNPNWHDVDSTS
jgi:hypothetical protein